MTKDKELYQGVDKETFEKERIPFIWDRIPEEENQLPIWFEEDTEEK